MKNTRPAPETNLIGSPPLVEKPNRFVMQTPHKFLVRNGFCYVNGDIVEPVILLHDFVDFFLGRVHIGLRFSCGKQCLAT